MLNNSFLLWKFKIFICHFGIVPYLKWLTFLRFQAYLEGAKQKTKRLENFAKQKPYRRGVWDENSIPRILKYQHPE